jgi:hypothetical protein
MRYIIVIFLMLGSLTYSQETVTKKLGDFHTLKVFNGLKVEVEKAATARVEISGRHANTISVKNSDGVLKIRIDILEGIKADDVRIVLYYSKDIQVIDANEGAYVSSEGKIKQDRLEIKVQEGARVNTELQVEHLRIKAVSGGMIQLKGKAEELRIEATTGGVVDAFEIKNEEAEVLSATGARVEVSTTDRLDARVRLRGIIYYKGSPKTLLTKKTVGGTIQQVD